MSQGFLALRMLTQQLDLADCNSVGEGHDVRVEMSSTFVKVSKASDVIMLHL